MSTTGAGVGPASESYGYTPLNQLASVNAATYGYDAADNITHLAAGDSLSYDATHAYLNLVLNFTTPASGTLNGNQNNVADALIAPRGEKALGTHPGDSGTLWLLDESSSGLPPRPIALQ